MTPAQIKAAVDNKLANIWAAVQTKQNAYFAAHGQCWQGLWTHSVIPADGNVALPDVGNATPYYQPDPWPAAFLSQTYPMAFSIHQYRTPEGVYGYQAFVVVKIVNQVWGRSAQVGPETWRAYPWTNITLT